MGYISPGMVAKKAYNWQVPENEAAPVVGYVTTLRDAIGDIEFFAQYLADFGDVQAFSGATNGFDAGETGSNLILSGVNNEIVAVNAEGSTLGVQERGPLPGTYALEYVVSGTSGIFPNLGLYATGGPPFDPEADITANGFCVYVEPNGDVNGAFGAPGVPANIGALSPGDVIGIVFRSDPSAVFFYLNGVFASEATLANNVVRPAVGGA